MPVTQTSSPTAKIDLFRGRTEVYPRRFESRKTGKSGYSPVCGNEWVRGICEKPRIKCSDCPRQNWLPVTNDVIRWHLSGVDDYGQPFVMGIYPMLLDERCWFLAADFDGKDWPADSKAFLSTCERLSVPAALERSRSGNGGHAWIFFAEAVPATIARKLGAHLLTESMEQRPALVAFIHNQMAVVGHFRAGQRASNPHAPTTEPEHRMIEDEGPLSFKIWQCASRVQICVQSLESHSYEFTRRKHHCSLPFCEYWLHVGSERVAEVELLKRGHVNVPTTLGEHLRNRRLKFGLRQEDAAARLGTMREVYDRWERDVREPMVSEWPGILGFLGYYPFPEQTPAGLVLKARRCQGADQKRLAGVIGVMHQRLRRWEHGSEVPDKEMAARLVELACLPQPPKFTSARLQWTD